MATVLVVEDGITDGQIISSCLQVMDIEVILVESSEVASNYLAKLIEMLELQNLLGNLLSKTNQHG